MDLRVVATTAGLVGGVCWVIDAFVDTAALRWGGLGLLLVGLGAAGALLVGRRAEVWLRVVAAVGFVALGWSVFEVARDAAGDQPVEGLAGGLAVVVSVVAFLSRPHSGSHRT